MRKFTRQAAEVEIRFHFMNLQQIENDIRLAFDDISKKLPNGPSRPEWTKEVLVAIGNIGKKYNYAVCGKYFDVEWLFDQCWYLAAPDDGRLTEVALVLEAEWDGRYNYIKYDFEKLLVAKSQLKIMAFNAAAQDMPGHLEKLEQSIHSYKGTCSGEVYIFAYSCHEGTSWKFQIKKVIVP